MRPSERRRQVEEAQLAAGGGYAPKPDGYGAHPSHTGSASHSMSARCGRWESNLYTAEHPAAKAHQLACMPCMPVSNGIGSGIIGLAENRMQVHSSELRVLHLCCSGAPGRGGSFGGGGHGLAGRTGSNYDTSSANPAEQSGIFEHILGSQVTEVPHVLFRGTWPRRRLWRGRPRARGVHWL